MRRIGATILVLVATGVLVAYAAVGPFGEPPLSQTTLDSSTAEKPHTRSLGTPDEAQVPTLAPPEPQPAPAEEVAVVEMPNGFHAERHVIFLPVKVEHVATGPTQGDHR